MARAGRPGGVSPAGDRDPGRRLDTGLGPGFAVTVAPLPFSGRIRFWDPARSAGLAVVDIPADLIAHLGGLRQARVRGTIGSADFVSNVMPAGGGRLALSVSKAMMSAAGVTVGDIADFTVARVDEA
jgi:hypothetical protein